MLVIDESLSLEVIDSPANREGSLQENKKNN